LREHDGLAGVVKFVRGKMEEKKADNAEARAQEEEEEEEEEEPILSDRESEEGGGVDHDEGDDEKPVQPTSPKKKKVLPPKSPKKKKVTSAGMQIPEYWPWEEAKKLFITPDVVKADDMEVGHSLRMEKAVQR
jgi:flap endonuclease-1